MAHEEDYESEDMDVQPNSPKLQHFKKQGPLFIWIALANAFWLYFGLEFLYQHYTDDEYFRKPRPPPLDHPNDTTTPDSKLIAFKKTPEYRYALDSGQIKPIQVSLVDGKKVIDKWAGVNQPMEFI